MVLVWKVSRYSHGFYLFPVVAGILSFSVIDPDSTIFRQWFGQFFGNRTDSIFSRYSLRFSHFPVLTLILPFFGTRLDNFSVLARILPYPVLARILPFSGTDPNSTIFWYSFAQFFGTRIDSTFSRYSPGFHHFPVLTLILPFFGTRSYSFSVIARILYFPGTRPDSFIFRF